MDDKTNKTNRIASIHVVWVCRFVRTWVQTIDFKLRGCHVQSRSKNGAGHLSWNMYIVAVGLCPTYADNSPISSPAGVVIIVVSGAK